MFEARNNAMRMWQAINDTRQRGNSYAIGEQLATLGEERSPWQFYGKNQSVEHYEVHLGFPISLYLQKLYEAYGGKRVLRVVDAFTSHTDPLSSLINGTLRNGGLPHKSMEGFAFGLSFMGALQERVEALQNGITFTEGNLFDPADHLFDHLDTWRTVKKGSETVHDTIDAVMCRLGISDVVTFKEIPPLIIHRMLGNFYERSSPNALFIFQVPQSIKDTHLQGYLSVLESDFGIEHIYREPFRTSADDPNLYGRSVVLIRNSHSTAHWPGFKEVLEHMAA